jgi:hypothetical protein
MTRLKCPFLRKAESWQSHPVCRFGDLHFDHRGVGGSHFGETQHRILREHFTVNLGNQIILAGRILAPHLSEFDVLNSHELLSFDSQTTQTVRDRQLQNRYGGLVSTQEIFTTGDT